ncbi:hypothetical protein [Horticoccus sp. 23ND18S-11]|uniref:hypothetical protein n=1 Tax=Horticoccus sp. 23ND18S-11 TaxID=3391832 RepID=UPI0039C9D266
MLARCVVGGLCAAAVPSARLEAAEAVRVTVVGTHGQAFGFPAAWQEVLAQAAGVSCLVTVERRDAARGLGLESLRSAQAAVFEVGPGELEAGAMTLLREFLSAGKGCVILGATREAWAALPGFSEETLGAEPGAPFAAGAPMTVINLFPHPIFAGVTRFETAQAMPGYAKLADDAQMIMEGTVGEATTPLAWVRRRPAGRIVHLVPVGPDVARDPAYQRIVANAVLWTLNRPIADAQAGVQRTFMPEAHPGAIALTLPNGPGVCLDPVRGGINYIWDGDFVDLRPRWLTKQGEPARIFGEIFYREKAWQPLRSGSPTSAPDFHFRGYTLQAGLPEFHYVIDGRDVFETISAAPQGTGIVRRFRVGPGARPLWVNLEPQASADVDVRGLERDGAAGCFPGNGAGEFSIEIRRKAGGASR